MDLPLAGFKVVELSTVVAAPTAARMLCAYGAQVIKVENLTGDAMRRAGLFERVICEDDKNPLFTVQNSNKRLVAVNLKSEDGKAALMRLLEDADVLLTNIRERSLEKLGIDYDALRQRFPRIVYAHLTGFGPEGPAASNPGFDSTAFWLRSGPMADWQVAGSFPMRPTYAFGDMATSSVLVAGILMALIARERTGRGTKVETSLYASGIWCNAIAVVASQFCKDRIPRPLRPPDPFSNFYLCSDGRWIGVFCNEYALEREKFARLFEMPELMEDPRYESIAALDDTGEMEEAVKKLNAVFLTRTSEEWRAYLSENSVACEVARPADDVCGDPQAVLNHYVERLDFADGVSSAMPCPPLEFSEYGRRSYCPAGRLGRDTDAVFAELGYAPEAIAALRGSGVIA